jgi:hypothetical protein
MGEKSVEFQSSLNMQECGMRFKSGIENGRGASAWIGVRGVVFTGHRTKQLIKNAELQLGVG